MREDPDQAYLLTGEVPERACADPDPPDDGALREALRRVPPRQRSVLVRGSSTTYPSTR